MQWAVSGSCASYYLPKAVEGELAKIAINGESGDYQRYPLIGGGSLLVADRQQNTKKFIDFGNLSSRKVLAIAVDEDESN